jgi:hypothetical protein
MPRMKADVKRVMQVTSLDWTWLSPWAFVEKCGYYVKVAEHFTLWALGWNRGPASAFHSIWAGVSFDGTKIARRVRWRIWKLNWLFVLCRGDIHIANLAALVECGEGTWLFWIHAYRKYTSDVIVSFITTSEVLHYFGDGRSKAETVTREFHSRFNIWYGDLVVEKVVHLHRRTVASR